MNPVDLRLYVILDPAVRGRHSLDALAVTLAENGATLFQLRDKSGDADAIAAQARAIQDALRARGIPLLINDHVEVAARVGADGVHLGQDDMPPDEARRVLGPQAIIGLTVKNEAHIAAVPLDVVDYVCIGGVFATMSKDNVDPPIGLDGLRNLAAAMRQRAPKMPAGAIAGIDKSNAAAAITAGADGVALISALSLADDPAEAARTLRGLVDAALHEREDAALDPDGEGRFGVYGGPR